MKGKIEFGVSVSYKITPSRGRSKEYIFAEMMKNLERDISIGVVGCISSFGFEWKAKWKKKK